MAVKAGKTGLADGLAVTVAWICTVGTWVSVDNGVANGVGVAVAVFSWICSEGCGYGSTVCGAWVGYVTTG